jgi:hypothetical protein
MTTTTCDPASPDAGPDPFELADSLLEAVLDRLDVDIASALASMPDNRIDARRHVVEELRIDPTAEELQTIERLSRAPDGEGRVRETIQSVLALRVMTERELQRLYRPTRLDAAELEAMAEPLAQLQEAVTAARKDLQLRQAAVEPAQARYLAEAEELLPSWEELMAAGVVAPVAGLLVRAAAGGSLRSVAPSLTEADGSTLAAALVDVAEDPEASLTVHAMAMRTVIRGDLKAWRKLRRHVGDEEKLAATRQLLADRLERNRTAYRILSGRLQDAQDRARIEGRSSAETLHRAKQKLFSTYRDLASTLNNPDAVGADDDDESDSDVASILEECSAEEARVTAEKSARGSDEELYLKALKNVRRPAVSTAADVATREAQRERKRVRVLSIAACVLLVVSGAVWSHRLLRRPAELDVPLTELSSGLSLRAPMAVGSMMYARVARAEWELLSRGERLARLDELGQGAVEQDFRSVYLTDEGNHHLATWTASEGATLAKLDP